MKKKTVITEVANPMTPTKSSYQKYQDEKTKRIMKSGVYKYELSELAQAVKKGKERREKGENKVKQISLIGHEPVVSF